MAAATVRGRMNHTRNAGARRIATGAAQARSYGRKWSLHVPQESRHDLHERRDALALGRCRRGVRRNWVARSSPWDLRTARAARREQGGGDRREIRQSADEEEGAEPETFRAAPRGEGARPRRGDGADCCDRLTEHKVGESVDGNVGLSLIRRRALPAPPRSPPRLPDPRPGTLGPITAFDGSRSRARPPGRDRARRRKRSRDQLVAVAHARRSCTARAAAAGRSRN